jgi:protocatechuate 3,4-dioxygenase beta subunit
MEHEERLRAIWDRTVEKLKEVVLEFKITEDELHMAGDFFNRLGQSGMSRSLIDVALAMTSIDAHRQKSQGTRPNLTGPYHAVHPVRADGKLYDIEPGKNVPRLALGGVVRNAVDGSPITNAEMDFWQADQVGKYDREGSHLRGVIVTDAWGRYSIKTVLPEDYSEHDFDPLGELFRAMGRTNTRAAHVHVKIRVHGQELLTTQLFMSTSNMLEEDYVEGAVTQDLIVRLEKSMVDGATLFTGSFDFAVAVPVSMAETA